MEFALANDLVVGNTCFRKRVSHLVTYSSSNHSTQIDYIIYRKSFRKAVNDVKVIPTEECVQQHNLLICDLTVCIPSAKKHKFIPRIPTWKLRDPAVSKDFQNTFKDKVAALTPVESADDVEDVWSKLKTPLLETASEVCGLSKKHQWKKETIPAITDQVMKLLDSFIREMVDIDAMQFGFVPGRGTTDAIPHHPPIAREVHRCKQATLLRLC